MRIVDRLMSEQDETYRLFQAKLMPTVDPGTIIGIRTPILRKMAKELKGSEEAKEFLDNLPHTYYDENNLHAFLLSESKDFDETISRLNAFLPYVNNWATCDSMNPKSFKKNRDKLKGEILRWLKSDEVYTVRFGIGCGMSYYLDEYDSELMEIISTIRSDEYYINMMIAWYFATALAKRWEETIVYLKEQRLDVWTHNKTIQKAIESYRITDEQKRILRAMKRG